MGVSQTSRKKGLIWCRKGKPRDSKDPTTFAYRSLTHSMYTKGVAVPVN
jgi:hypothetical protein